MRAVKVDKRTANYHGSDSKSDKTVEDGSDEGKLATRRKRLPKAEEDENDEDDVDDDTTKKTSMMRTTVAPTILLKAQNPKSMFLPMPIPKTMRKRQAMVRMTTMLIRSLIALGSLGCR